MRSRYSAFALQQIDYILETTALGQIVVSNAKVGNMLHIAHFHMGNSLSMSFQYSNKNSLEQNDRNHDRKTQRLFKTNLIMYRLTFLWQ
jgi:uncharacterized protein YchJ